MLPHAVTAARSTGLALLLAAVTACGNPPSSPPPSAGVVPSGVVAPAASPVREPTVMPGSGPPDAVLFGTDDEPVPGDLGTFTWDGLVSDSPWLPGADAGRAGVADPLRVELRALEATGWSATWARIANGQAADPAAGVGPATGPIELHAPPETGTWSLRVLARFGTGREAAWYWWMEVGP